MTSITTQEIPSKYLVKSSSDDDYFNRSDGAWSVANQSAQPGNPRTLNIMNDLFEDDIHTCFALLLAFAALAVVVNTTLLLCFVCSKPDEIRRPFDLVAVLILSETLLFVSILVWYPIVHAEDGFDSSGTTSIEIFGFLNMFLALYSIAHLFHVSKDIVTQVRNPFAHAKPEPLWKLQACTIGAICVWMILVNTIYCSLPGTHGCVAKGYSMVLIPLFQHEYKTFYDVTTHEIGSMSLIDRFGYVTVILCLPLLLSMLYSLRAFLIAKAGFRGGLQISGHGRLQSYSFSKEFILTQNASYSLLGVTVVLINISHRCVDNTGIFFFIILLGLRPFFHWKTWLLHVPGPHRRLIRRVYQEIYNRRKREQQKILDQRECWDNNCNVDCDEKKAGHYEDEPLPTMGEMSGQHSITLDHKLSPKPHSHDDGSGKPHSHDGQRGSCGSTSRGIQMNLSPMSTIQVDNVSKHLRTEVINLVA